MESLYPSQISSAHIATHTCTHTCTHLFLRTSFNTVTIRDFICVEKRQQLASTPDQQRYPPSHLPSTNKRCSTAIATSSQSTIHTPFALLLYQLPLNLLVPFTHPLLYCYINLLSIYHPHTLCSTAI